MPKSSKTKDPGPTKPARNGKGWATREQKDWLELFLPHFLEAQRKKSTRLFLCDMYEKWFEAFPEADVWFPPAPGGDPPHLTLAETQLVEEKIKTRKATLQAWFYHQTQVGKYSKKPSAKDVFNFAASSSKSGPAPKLLRPDQMYQKLFPEKVLPRMAEERGKKDATDRSGRTSSQFRTALEMYEAEPDEVKEYVVRENLKQKEARLAALKEEEHAETIGDERTPEEALNACPEVVTDGLKKISKETGWAWFAIGAGPVPNANGTIYKKWFYVGPKSQAGNTFMESYQGFEENVMLPFGKFVSGCYSADVRRQRALKTGLTAVEHDILDHSGLLSMDRTPSVIPSGTPSLGKSHERTPPPPPSAPSSPLPGIGFPGSPSMPPSLSPRKSALGRFRTDRRVMPRSDDPEGLDLYGGSATRRHSPPDSPSPFAPQPDGGPSSPIAHAFRHWLPDPSRDHPDSGSSPRRSLSPRLIDPSLLLEPSEEQLNSTTLDGPVLPGFGGDSSAPRRDIPLNKDSTPVAPSAFFSSTPAPTTTSYISPGIAAEIPSSSTVTPIPTPSATPTGISAAAVISPPLATFVISATTLPRPSLPRQKPRPKPIKKPSALPITSAGIGAKVMSASLYNIEASISGTCSIQEGTDDTHLTRAQKTARTKALDKPQREVEKEPRVASKKRKENPSTSEADVERRPTRKIVAPKPPDAGASPLKPKKRATRKR